MSASLRWLCCASTPNPLSPLPQQYTTYFCGFHEDCVPLDPHKLLLSQAGQQRALDNLRNEYLVVGITEHYADSLKLFKHLLPTYFSAVEQSQAIPHRNRNPHRPKAEVLSAESKQVLAYGHDHQLYAVALELFQAKFRACFG